MTHIGLRLISLKILVVWLLCQTGIPVQGQVSKVRLSFHHLSPSDGLSQGTNAWIFRDSYGLIWISSLDGLNRFDGQSIKSYKFNPTSNNCIADNIVTSTFFEDENRDLWFTTYSAINVYRREKDEFETYRLKSNQGEEITEDYFAFFMDQGSRLWVRTGIRENGILQLFDCSDYTAQIQGPLKGQRQKVIITDNDTLIISSLVAQTKGVIVNHYQDRRVQPINQFFDGSQNAPALTIYNVCPSSPNKIWLGAKDGLIKLNLTTGEYQIFDKYQGQSLGVVRSIVKRNEHLYISSNSIGLLVFDEVKNDFVEQFLPDPKDELSLRSRRLSKLYIDNKQCLWVSYFESGGDGVDFAQLDKNRLPILKVDDLKSYQAKAIVENDDGEVVISIGNTLYQFDKNRIIKDSWILDGKIQFVYKDNYGIVWVAARSENQKTVTFYQLSKEGPKAIIANNTEFLPRDMCQLSTGQYLIASEDRGIIEMTISQDELIFSNPKGLENFNNAFVSKILEGPNKKIYASINFDRLAIATLEDQKFSVEKLIPGLGECKSFYFFSDNSIAWISASLGLIELDTKSLDYHFLDQQETGLPQKRYFNLMPSTNDQLWLRSDRELYQYSFLNKTYAKFGIVDGLEEVAGDHQPAIIDRGGYLWLAGKDGINLFHPDSIATLSPPSKPLVTKISVNDEPYETNRSYLVIDSLDLNYFNSTVTFEFVACDYADPKNVRYEYRLLGQDVNWIDGGNRGFIRFNKLPPGEYTFQVMTINSDERKSAEPANVYIKIRPPFWATTLAYIVYGILFLGLLWLIRYLESRKQRKRLEEEQRKVAQEKRINEELRKLDQLKDQFLANTSHELRTPLNGIIGLAESLMEGATGQLPPKTLRNLGMIASSGKRLAKLVNDILDFSKLNTETLALDVQPVDVHTAGDVVLTLLEPLKREKSIALINDIPADIPLVKADENRLQQILYNLLGNAVKFTPSGSIKISAQEKGGQILVSVSDTGIGIPAGQLDQIFTSFHQLDGSTTRHYSGAGLGLSVTKQLVELHGGEIFVESIVDQGSIFSFSLPKSEVKRSEMPGLEPSQPDQLSPITTNPSISIEKKESQLLAPAVDNGISILVVDDEPVNREVLQNYLSISGYTVLQANNGQSALDIVEKETVNLIILDIMMPGMSGLEVCKSLRKKYPANVLPIVMLTAKNSVNDLVKGFAVGANDYLAKPFSKDELLTRIRTHISLQNIFSTTGRFVPHEFLNAIGRQEITDVELGDHVEVDVTVMFSDIRDYTHISESMSPTENFKFVNEFVGRMGPIIQKNRGFVNQYLGDGIMAIFPISPLDATKAGVEMLEEVQRLNVELNNKGAESIRVGIGLHSGPLIMGIIGDENRSDPATIADTVNVSSRLESLTKHYRTNLLVSGDCLTGEELKDPFNYRYLGKVRLKGKKDAIDIYECVEGDSGELRKHKIETKTLFESGLTAYLNKDFDKAAHIFEEVISANSNDGVARYFVKKSSEYLVLGVSDNWDGIENMTKK